jgi:hypothetical protein
MIAKLDVLKDKFELDQLDLSDDPEEGKRLAVERWEDCTYEYDHERQ